MRNRKEDMEFMERISRDLEMRRAASRLLNIDETADKEQLKKAYRKVASKFHPDKNQDDPDANRKFLLVKCAYKLLAEDEPCPELLEEISSLPDGPDDKRYNLDNPWGHFLWWREKFF